MARGTVVLSGENVSQREAVVNKLLFEHLIKDGDRGLMNYQYKMFYLYKNFDTWVTQGNRTDWFTTLMGPTKQLQVLTKIDRDEETGQPYRWIYVTPDKIVGAVVKGDSEDVKIMVSSIWTGGTADAKERAMSGKVALLFYGTPLSKLLARSQSIRDVKKWVKVNNLEGEFSGYAGI